MNGSLDGRCVKCGNEGERRGGFCWNCAINAERAAYHRTVVQHVVSAVKNARRGKWQYARFDIEWAWGRLTRTGDYSTGGYFEREHGKL